MLRIGAVGLFIVGLMASMYAAIQFLPAFTHTNEGSSPPVQDNDQSVKIDQENNQDAGAEETLERDDNQVDEPAKQQSSNAPAVLYTKRPEIGEEFGTLEIPVINQSFPIIHGTEDDVLEEGVGHYRGSVLPGEPDHSILSAHRDTYFRNLGDVRHNDNLIVTTDAGTFTYAVVSTYIVDADDTTVIRPTEGATLSLTTCYPFNYIGDAPERYIVHAKLVE